ncbi:MAG: hypothetical protein AAFQ94_06460 [Bacteroidota bacterium]
MIKRLLTLSALILAITFSASAQKKIKYSDLEGKKWKLTIDIREEIEEELDDSDSFFERLVIKSVGGLVDNILDEIDIYFEFRKNNELKVTVYAFGEREVEYTEWRINRNGALVIEDTDSFKSDRDDEWYMVDDVIIAYDSDKRKIEDGNVYLVQVDK